MRQNLLGSESMFSRLFTYARSTNVAQIENFTTEALAACIARIIGRSPESSRGTASCRFPRAPPR